MGASKTSKRGAPKLTRQELNAARLVLLRRRVSVFALVIGSLVIVKTLLVTALASWQGLTLDPLYASIFVAKLAMGLGIVILPGVRRDQVAKLHRRQIVLLMSFVVVLAVFSQVSGADLLGRVISTTAQDLGLSLKVSALPPLLVILTLVYTSAACIVPWTVREATGTLIVMALIFGIGTLAVSQSITTKGLYVCLTLLAGMPGVVLSWYRSSRLREKVLLAKVSGRYRRMQQDLAAARGIHERLFPAQLNSGPVHIEHSYQPARQIGGDFLDVIRQTNGKYMIVVLDVTGHGIAAAMAVNRLQGEIRRLVAEYDGISPGKLMSGLNRYTCLTLADEGIFATGIAIQVDPEEHVLLYCNAGHPPALHRRRDGSVAQLEPNTAMLGVLDDNSFAPSESGVRLAPGEPVVAYTDGATELNCHPNEMFGLRRLTRTVGNLKASTPHDIVAALGRRLETVRVGAVEDDVLLVCLAIVPEAPTAPKLHAPSKARPTLDTPDTTTPMVSA